MKQIYKTEGYIIKRKKFGEADRLLTFFSQRLGKIIVLAKGSRKIMARNIGNLELFYCLDCQLAEGKTFYLLTSAEILETFPSIRRDLKKTALACQIGELVDCFLPEKAPNFRVYQLLKESLDYLEKDGFLLLPYFRLKLLFYSGFLGQSLPAGRLTKNGNKLFRLLLNNQIQILRRLTKIEKTIIKEIENYSAELVKNTLEREPKSANFSF